MWEHANSTQLKHSNHDIQIYSGTVVKKLNCSASKSNLTILLLGKTYTVERDIAEPEIKMKTQIL